MTYVYGHRFEDTWWKGKIEQPICPGSKLLVLIDPTVKLSKISIRVVGSRNVVIETPKFLVALFLARLDLHVGLALGAQTLDRQTASRVTVERRRLGQKVVTEQPPERRVDLLLGEVALVNKNCVWVR